MFALPRSGLAAALTTCTAASLLATGCWPDGDLRDEGTSDPVQRPAAGAGLIDPEPGASAVPPNLQALTLRLDPPLPPDVTPLLRLVPLGKGDGSVLRTARATHCPTDAAGACYRAALDAALLPTLRYGVDLVDGTLAADRVAGRLGEFLTAAMPDLIPPAVDAVDVVAQDCVRLHATWSERARATVAFQSGGAEQGIDLGSVNAMLDVVVPFPEWLVDQEGVIVLRLTDLAGNAVERVVPVRGPAPAPPLVITEVLANPAGSEYTQEYVEVANAGADPMALDGLQIEDAAGVDRLPPVVVPPGGRALIVAMAYDPADPADGVPAAGTELVRVEGRIGRDGLSNGGEPVRLRTVEGAVVSSYGGWADVSAAAWNGRSVHRLAGAPDVCDRPAAWSGRPMLPTPGR